MQPIYIIYPQNKSYRNMLQHICKSSVVIPYVNGNDMDKYRIVTNLI